MSKGHKKRYQSPVALSNSTEKFSTATSTSEEPIKLERVLLSDEFYWQVPGDVPASNKHFGMKMVLPAETQVPVQTISSAPLLFENKANIDTSPQDEKDTAGRAEESSKSVTAIENLFLDSNRKHEVFTAATTESKSKVAATILPRTDTTRLDSTLDSEQEEAVLSTPRRMAEKEKSTGWRASRVWFVLPLLLLLGGVLYDALSNNENVIGPVVEINVNDIAKTSVSEQVLVSDDTAIVKTEINQIKPVLFITHVVVKGDTLWDISKRYHNDPFRYPELAELSNIENPDLIYPGEIITITITQAVDNNEGEL